MHCFFSHCNKRYHLKPKFNSIDFNKTILLFNKRKKRKTHSNIWLVIYKNNI